MCEVTKNHRNRCQYCRLQKCLSMGMRSDCEYKSNLYNLVKFKLFIMYNFLNNWFDCFN